jgi:hypothetical protein
MTCLLREDWQAFEGWLRERDERLCPEEDSERGGGR